MHAVAKIDIDADLAAFYTGGVSAFIRMELRPFIEELLEHCKAEGRPIRSYRITIEAVPVDETP